MKLTALRKTLPNITPPCMQTVIAQIKWSPTITVSQKNVKSSTWEISIVRLYAIAIYVLVIWCDILPNSNNHTRSIMKFKYRLNQTLLNI